MHFALVAMRELQSAVLEGKERIVGTTTHVVSGVDVRAVLANDDVAGRNLLTGKTLYPEALCPRITSVSG